MSLLGGEQAIGLAPELNGTRSCEHAVPPAQSVAGEGYRADIDGLRAIAVAIVVIFHTGISPLRGGFVGVDIFFVISGYLITRQINTELEAGRFSIVSFYERRVRRIVPALLFVVALTMAVGPFVLFPSELTTTGLTGIASIASVANLFLLSTSGYFEADAASQPLVHMWSLGVEEQFYLFFPLLLAAFAGRRWLSTRAITLLVAALSLTFCIVATRYDRDFAYYFPLTRAWELLIGAALVFLPAPAMPRLVRDAAAACAALLILACAVKFYPNMAFPGFYALAPCLAAAALIHVGGSGGSFVSRVLAMPPMVAVGQWSYSLYLVHWPILVFYGLVRGAPATLSESVGLVAASLVAAYLSWRFVERPFRQRQLLGTRRALFAGAGLAAALLVAVIAAIIVIAPSATAPSQADRLAGYLTYDDTAAYRRGSCFLFGHKDRLSDFDQAQCLTPARGKPNVLLLGDSHAAHLWSGLQGAFPDANVMQSTSTGCKPVLGAKGEKTCVALMDRALGTFLASSRPDVIILSARWIESDITDVERTLRALAGSAGQVVVLGPIVEYAMPLPRLLAQVAGGRDPSLLIDARVGSQRRIDQELSAAVTRAGGSYVSVYQMFCASDAAPCQTMSKDVPVQWDYGHLTAEGSLALAEKLKASGALALPEEPVR